MFERAKELAGRLFGQDEPRRRAHELYVSIAEAARRREFYTELGGSDTPEGRYEFLTLHMALVLRRLKADREQTAKFAQLLFDVMFRDVDDTLREMGVGDLRVGKKVREHAEAFFGRTLAYERGLEGEEELSDVLARNVYEDPAAPMATGLAAYVRSADRHLAQQSTDDIMRGMIEFPAIGTDESAGEQHDA